MKIEIPTRAIAITSLLLLIQGCASNPTAGNKVMTDAESCSALKHVVEQSKTDFNTLKDGTRHPDYDHDHWDAKPIFNGAECDVIKWGSRGSNFVCNWEKDNEQAAKKDYASGLATIESCLSKEWTSSPIAGAKGEAKRFAKAGETTVIDVRVYQERAPANGWLTGVSVGPAINRDAR